jgi:hypothetical protein
MNRRHFLAALGLGAGAPLLTPLLSNILRAQEGGLSPRRVVIFVEGNGVEANALLSPLVKQAIVDAGGSNQRYASRGYKHTAALEIANAGLGESASLGALKASGDDSSLESKAALIMGLSSKITGGGHSTGHGALSCTRKRKAGPSRATIESVLSEAEQLKGMTPFKAIRLGVEKGNSAVVYGTCAFGKNKPAPIIINPTSAFNVLFGSVSTGQGRKVFAEKSDLLDFTRADINRTLSEFPGSSPERAKLEDYLESVEALITRQSQIEGMSDTLTQVKPEEPADQARYGSGDPFKRMHAQTDLAIAALKGGLTQVVVVTMGTEGEHGFGMQYPSVQHLYPGGKVMAGHDLRHAAEHGNADCINVLHAVTAHNVSQMARLARSLEATPEFGHTGSMLDHTVMLYMSSNGEKHHSNAEEWPMLMIGGQKLGFKTDGRAVVYPRSAEDRHRQVSNMFNTLGHAVGVDLNEFGEEASSRKAQGPLTELWQA